MRNVECAGAAAPHPCPSPQAGRGGATADADAAATALRSFTRFYTSRLGVLGEGLLDSPFSLPHARLLYELAQRPGVAAADLGRDLGLDPGYLSRLLRGLVAQGFVARAPAKDDARRKILRLTAKGRAAFAPLDRASQAQATAMVAPLGEAGRARLVAAMAEIEQALAPCDASPFAIRDHRIGDIGHVVSRHGALYARDYGWDATFEAMVAEIGAAFIRNFDPEKECCRIALRHGAIVGSAFVVKQSDTVAKLRLVYVEPDARGLGIGAALVADCVAFAKSRGYSTMSLWTNDILVSARKIYEAQGFRLVAEERHHSFGQDLVGQNWDLALRAGPVR